MVMMGLMNILRFCPALVKIVILTCVLLQESYGLYVPKLTNAQFNYQACSPVSYLAAFPGDCNKFYTCTTAGYFPMRCPSNLYFSEARQQCDYQLYVPECRNPPPRTRCSPNPCIQGQCTLNSVSSVGYTCSCNPGYQGVNCTEDVNECNTEVPPCGPGQCVNSLGSFTCNCLNTGYTGDRCQTRPNFCGSSPCVRGVCNEGSTTFQCDCSGTGYTGTTCNIPGPTNFCSSSPCVRGVCSEGSTTFQCDCSGTGYTGTTCNIPERDFCAETPCRNGGQCTNQQEGFKCDCTGTGYIGDFCDIPSPTNFCSSSPCVRGVCSEGSTTFQCDCSGTGYTGTTCNIPVTPTNNCNSNPCFRGTCTNTADGYICDCAGTGYSGRNCNNTIIGPDDCTPNPCTNGACIDGDNTFTCDCTGTIYKGALCDLTECNIAGGNPCQNGGTCVPSEDEYRCLCPAGLEGGNCEIVTPPQSGACPVYSCPIDVPRYNYPDWNDTNCRSFYNCEHGIMELRTCPFGEKFDIITMRCQNENTDFAFFCSEFKQAPM